MITALTADNNSFWFLISTYYEFVPYHNLCHGVQVMLYTQNLLHHQQGYRILGQKIKVTLMYAGLVHDIFHNGFTDTTRTELLKGSLETKKIYLMEK